MRKVICCVAAVAALWSVDAAAECPISDTNPNEEIDVVSLQGQLERVTDVGLDVLWDELWRGSVNPPDSIKLHAVHAYGRRNLLVTWSQCKNDYGCTAHAAIVEWANGRAKREARTLLPYWWDGGDTVGDVFVKNIGVTQIDGLRGDELVIDFEVREPERADGTTMRHIATGVWQPERLALKWIWETEWQDTRSGDRCTASVWRRDVNCDGRTDLVVEKSCDVNGKRTSNKTGFKHIKGPNYWLAWGEKETLQPIEDDRPWVVVAGNIPVIHSDHEERAQKVLQKVQDAGFKDAEIFNSRRFERMNCCYRTIVVGRFPDKKQARALRDELKKKKLRAYVQKGF